jgi:hypothetical protein
MEHGCSKALIIPKRQFLLFLKARRFEIFEEK